MWRRQPLQHWQGRHGPARLEQSDSRLSHSRFLSRFPMRDERKATFRDLAAREGDTFGYEYDSGDSWTHEVLLEKLLPVEQTGQYPACTDGARACPPEDCGGTTGYQELLDALAGPRHPDHHELRRWLDLEQGANFDPYVSAPPMPTAVSPP
ncbi:plasmid pRiA4b ORF-3 family protein [Actinoplanes sp. NPDC049802]|uniref:plasmid pRiA4b ORF-3 family protein n=1 Tax=Actinoplanes sp. NPDC049802 TaxID=3154742 RepID=UPI0034015EE9